MLRVIFLATLGLGVLAVAGLWLAARTAGPQSRPGVYQGRLAPCPTSPNCVSSQADPQDARHYVAPIPYTGTREAARRRLLEILRHRPRTRVVEVLPDYVHAEVRSRLFGFVDDVEFLFDEHGERIHVRSASRVGYGDFGVNRRRIRELARAFSQDGPAVPASPR